jgi:hypothetical protein
MIICIIILLLLAFAIFCVIRDDEWAPFLISVIIFGVGPCLMIWGISYETNADLRVFHDSTHKQYMDNIVMYKDAAKIEFDSPALTDLKYQHYQTEIGKDIADLQRSIKEYNASLIRKRIYKDNIVWGWLIFLDDDLDEIRIEELQ